MKLEDLIFFVETRNLKVMQLLLFAISKISKLFLDNESPNKAQSYCNALKCLIIMYNLYGIFGN